MRKIHFKHSIEQYLHSNAVILVPDAAVVNPHIPARHVEAVRVEGGQINDSMVALVGSLGAGKIEI